MPWGSVLLLRAYLKFIMLNATALTFFLSSPINPIWETLGKWMGSLHTGRCIPLILVTFIITVTKYLARSN